MKFDDRIYSKGARVRPTEEFRRNFPRSKAQIGTVLSHKIERQGVLYRIQWDEFRTPERLSSCFVCRQNESASTH